MDTCRSIINGRIPGENRKIVLQMDRIVRENSQSPLVSIITPAYNRAPFVDETIQSVLTQDYPNFEYIVLDDGSKDSTREVLARYEGRIRWDSHANMGEVRTVNKGFEMAKGEILCVVNSDDPLLPGAISCVVEAMMRHPEVVVAYPDWDMIDAEGKGISHRQTFEYDYLNMVRWFHCVPGPGAFFRKSVVTALGGRDAQFRYVSDFDFWLRAGLLGPFKRVPKTLATFRRHSDGASSKDQGIAMAEEHIRLARKLFSIPDLPPGVAAVKREAFGSAYYTAALNLGDASSRLKKWYLIKALASAPSKYLFQEYRERLIGPIVFALTGPKAHPFLAKFCKVFPLREGIRCPH